jgi:hypothetical protein
MVKANKAATAIRSQISGGAASLWWTLVGAVVEEGIVLLSSSVAIPSFSAGAGSPPPPAVLAEPRPEQGTAEIKAALVAAEKKAVIFDADLSPSPVANRTALNNAFAAGHKATALKVADESGEDVAGGIQIVNDALSCTDNVEFLGQTTAR